MTGVPTPGAMAGSQTSRSNDTWMPAVPAPAIAIACSVDGGDALPVDVLHREDVHARGAHHLLLALVEIADADQHRVLRPDLRREAADLRELGGSRPEQRGERHAVHVAAERRRRRVHVAVRVHPDAGRAAAALAGPMRRRGRHRSGAEAVVAAEHERQCRRLERRERAS